MSEKLNEREQQMVPALTKVLVSLLPPQQRSHASGIASRLVRLNKDQGGLSADDVADVLQRFYVKRDVREALVERGVLVETGTYTASGSVIYRLVVEEEPAAAADADVDDTDASPESAPDEPADPTPAEEVAVSNDEEPADPPSDETAEGAEPDDPKQAIAKTGESKPSAQKRNRSLAHLDTVRKQTPELNSIRLKIIDLDPRMWINGWLLSTPEAYVRYEPELRAISAALEGSQTLGDGTLSCRELSYQIFGDEKYLGLEEEGRKLLHLMGLSDLVVFRPQAKLGLLHHIPTHHKHMRIVVSENLDPWLNMRDAMYRKGQKRFFGERIHGVVFGNGYVVNDSHKLPDLLDALEAESVEVLYWGDIDRAGLQIMNRLRESMGDAYPVKPFIPAYRTMIERAMQRFPNPLDNEPCEQEGLAIEGIELFDGALPDEDLDYLRSVVEGSRLIPQEILTSKDL